MEKKQAEVTDYTSLTPRFTFAQTLDQQQVQLSENPLLERFRRSRKALASDPHRPLYHFVSPESSLNDPNGLCFWNGKWHLFYQAYPQDNPPDSCGQHWGHTISDDLIHWQDLPYAIYPNPEAACFSGATLVEQDRVIAMYHGTRVGNMVAISSDPLLLNWEKLTGKAVIPIPTPKPGEPSPEYNIFDPCIWKKDGFYYSLSAGTIPHAPSGKKARAEFVFRSKDLKNWEYLHPFLEGDIFGLIGDDGACPYFWPIGDQHILLHFSHISGGKYMLGDYDTRRDKFLVTSGGDFNFGSSEPGGVHAPSACPDGNGGIVAIFNMNPAKPTKGWDQIMSLPRSLTLTGRDQLSIAPAGNIESLRHDHQHIGKMTLPPNDEVILDNIKGNAMEIIAEIDAKNAPTVELNILRSPGREEFTRIMFYKERGLRDWQRYEGWDREKRHTVRDSLISIDSSQSSTLSDVSSRPPETAPVYVGPDETLTLRIFIDKSSVEVFVNDRQCVAMRVYPGREDSLGVSLHAHGSEAVLKQIDAWQMKSIYDTQ